ncbi:MAG: alpha/beta fold hydrolase [Myxococcota bacterium]
MNTASEVIEAHQKAGRFFDAANVKSFVREAGTGAPIVLMHGVPASSFLYRKVLAEIADRGARGIAFDLPGLGLADRPDDYDYTWTGLGRFARAAVDKLEVDRFHLVVHDIGGPVGFELAAAIPDRIRSLTILNTIVDVASFRRPWTMQPFAVSGLGALWLKTMIPPLFRRLMFIQGIADRSAITNAELDAWVALLKRGDGGRAFLKIMQGFELTEAKQSIYREVVKGNGYPVQIVWGDRDPALPLDARRGRPGFGRLAQTAAGLEKVHTVPAKHFLQEDQAPALADHIVRLAMASAKSDDAQPS